MNNWSCGWPAPAKLNLLLLIIGQRADGYHELQTVFQFVDYSDLLDFRLRADSQICRITDLPGVEVENDLVVRAARLLQEHAKIKLGVDIRVDKRLPMGGGLGGGSSDAATVLVALNFLWNCGLSTQDLALLGVKLGADVPIFVRGKAAWAEGVGDQFQSISLIEPYFLVISPPCHVSTAEIFCDPQLTRDTSRIKIRAFIEGDIRNDCLSVVCKRHPEVAYAMQWLDDFAQARLTGTGGCVFAAFESEHTAREVLQQLPERHTGFVAKGLNSSPLLAKLAEVRQVNTG